MAVIKALRIAIGFVLHGAAQTTAFQRDLRHKNSGYSNREKY
jgi:hypothetical protein